MTLRDTFLRPRNPAQRRYEVLRARYVDGMDCKAAAEAFGYSIGSFRNLCSAFNADPGWAFFQPPEKPKDEESAPGATVSRRHRNRRILELQQERQMSIHQIAAVLAAEDCPASLSTVAKVISEAGLGAAAAALCCRAGRNHRPGCRGGRRPPRLPPLGGHVKRQL